MSRYQLAILVNVVVFAGLLSMPQPALAHEQRQVGPYRLTVGFASEPALVNQTNGISLAVVTAADQTPVEGLDKTVKAEVIVGGNARSMAVPLRARFGQPGSYVGDLIPTATGAYIFRFSGTIGDTTIDERFESGPGRFDEVKPLTPLQFPNKLPDPGTLQQELADARSAADSARMFGIAGIIFGIVGIAFGAAALASRARAAQWPTGARA